MMAMKRIKRYCVYAVLLAIPGCTLRDLATVPLLECSITLTTEQPGIKGKSSLWDAECEYKVNDFNILYYRDGIFAGARYYAPGDYDLSPEGVRAEFGLLSGYSYSVYVIANMGDLTALPSFPVSESAMRKLSLDAGLAASPALPMAGHANLSAGNNVSILLHRLVARVNCNITLPEDAQLEEVRLCQAPVICTPFLSGFRAGEGEVADGDRFSFDPSSCGRYISGPAGKKGYTLRSEPLYVFENMQGVQGGNSDPWNKIPSDGNVRNGATYVLVKALFPDGAVIYRFYLGADATSDYNLERNKSYTLNISIWDAEASKSTWSMIDLRYSDNWPSDRFYVGQQRSFSFLSGAVRLVSEDPSVAALTSDGLGKWMVSALSEGETSLRIVSDGQVLGSIPIEVSGWQGVSGELQLGLFGNAESICERGIEIGGELKYLSDAGAETVCDNPGMLSSEIVHSCLNEAETSFGKDIPREKFGIAKAGADGACDSLFVLDPRDWADDFGKEKRFGQLLHLENLSAGVSLDVVARVINALSTESSGRVEFVIHNYSLASPGANSLNEEGYWNGQTLSFVWHPYEGTTEAPLPETAEVSVSSRMLSNNLAGNEAVSYHYSGGSAGSHLWEMSLDFSLSSSTDLSHACGLAEVYAEVLNRRSGYSYRTPLFLEEHFLHVTYGAFRTFQGEMSTGGNGNYCYDAICFTVMPLLTANTTHQDGLVNPAVELLSQSGGLFEYTGPNRIFYQYRYDWYNEAEGAAYVFVGQKAMPSNGVPGLELYCDYFMEYEHKRWSKPWQFYGYANDTELNERGPWMKLAIESASPDALAGDGAKTFSEVSGIQIGTADARRHPKNTRYHGRGYLVLENSCIFDDGSYGWLDY